MKELLKLWLQKKLGIVINTDKIAHAVKDGMIFIQLLKCYDAVNVNSIRGVFPSDDDDICRNNLMQLKVWFKLIGINFTDDIINGIINGNASLCINILYQLFSVFEKSSIHLKTKQTERLSLTDDKEKFKVTRLNIPQKHDDHGRSSIYNYEDRMLKCRDMVNYYKQKISTNVRNKILRRCGSIQSITSDTTAKEHVLRSKMSICPELDRKVMRKSVQFLDKADNKSINLCFGDSLSNLLLYECNEKAYDRIKLMTSNELGDVSVGKSNFLPPIKSKSIFTLPQHVQNYMTGLELCKGFAYKRRPKKCCHSVISDVWNSIVDNEKSHLKQTFASKLLKQSIFEKNLGLNLLTILKHNEILKQQYTETESCILNSSKPVEPISEFEEDILCDYDIDCVCESSDRGHKSYECDTGPRYFKTNVLRYKFSYYDEYCKNENDRFIELNTRLYAENLKMQQQKHRAICYSVLQDIIDLAVSKSEFKSEFGCELPDMTWNFWKILFYHERPVTSVVDNLELLMFLDAPEGINFSEEMINDNILNDAFLDMYLEESGYWKLDNDESAEEESELFLENRLPPIRYESQVLLGYIVHRILEMKYPVTPLAIPADIPKYPIMAIIDAIEDSEAVNSLKTLLMKADVLVVDVNDAINFCLHHFKNEKKNFNIFYGDENDIHSSHTIEEFSFSETYAPNKTEFSQTDSNIFEIAEEEDLKNVSQLGREVLNKFLSGTEIPSSLIVDMVIQYIKHHRYKIKGWVLVNYPCSINDASVIEVALSSKVFPIPFYEDDRTSASGVEDRVKNDFKSSIPGDFFSSFESEVRNSRLVPNPRNLNDSDAFKTYFSMYIKTVKGKKLKTRDSHISAKKLSDNINETTLLVQPAKFGIPTLLGFYLEQGIGYEFIYETFDMDTLKQLARLIIMHHMEDFKLLKLPDDFIEELLHELELTVETKWLSPHSKANGHVTDFAFNENHFNSQFTVEELEYDRHSYYDDISVVSKIKEDGFSFADKPILENAALALANFWETLESLYIVDLKSILFVMRNLDFNAIPYISSVCKQLELYFNREDERQTILTEFLDAYNSILQKLRSDKEMKNELHLRVEELKGRLNNLCLKHRNSCEELRVNIVRHNWIYQELTFCTNLFLHLVENEVTRCLNTLEFLQNYYLSMLGNYSFQRLPTVSVMKLDVHYGESENKPTLSVYVPSGAHKDSWEIDSYYLSTIDRILNYDKVQENINPFFEFLENETNKSFDEVLRIKSQVDDLIAKEETSAAKNYEEKHNLKTKRKIASSTNKKVKSTGDLPEIQTQQDTPFDERDEDKIKEQNIKIFEEWRSSVKNEIVRLASRIELVINKAVQKLSNIEDILGNKFYELKCKINERYLAETICIDNIVELFQTAIEEEIPISAKLVFHQNNYYTIPTPEESPEPPANVPIALEEMLSEESFTVDQLTHLKGRLRKIAPNGIIAREALVKFIYNTIMYSSCQGNIKLVPKLWSRIQLSDLNILFQKLFGNNGLIECRDFLIYCLDLPYPLTEDVIDARMQFLRYDLEETELINFEDFMKTTLWFEREVPENPLHALRNIRSKKFLFSIFISTYDRMAYTSLLLTLCRDRDPIAGFGKALSVIAGRCVIVYDEDLYLEEILTDDVNTKIKVATGILNGIINDVVDNSMSSGRVVADGKNILSLDTSTAPHSIVNSRITKSMYKQIFRGHSVHRWTSVIPSNVVLSLITLIRYTVLVPHNVFLQTDMYFTVQNHFLGCYDSDQYVPDLMKSKWLNQLIECLRKFKSLSAISIIKDLINKWEVK